MSLFPCVCNDVIAPLLSFTHGHEVCLSFELELLSQRRETHLRPENGKILLIFEWETGRISLLVESSSRVDGWSVFPLCVNSSPLRIVSLCVYITVKSHTHSDIETHTHIYTDTDGHWCRKSHCSQFPLFILSELSESTRRRTLRFVHISVHLRREWVRCSCVFLFLTPRTIRENRTLGLPVAVDLHLSHPSLFRTVELFSNRSHSRLSITFIFISFFVIRLVTSFLEQFNISILQCPFEKFPPSRCASYLLLSSLFLLCHLILFFDSSWHIRKSARDLYRLFYLPEIVRYAHNCTFQLWFSLSLLWRTIVIVIPNGPWHLELIIQYWWCSWHWGAPAFRHRIEQQITRNMYLLVIFPWHSSYHELLTERHKTEKRDPTEIRRPRA